MKNEKCNENYEEWTWKVKMKIIKIMKNEIMKNEKCNEKLWKLWRMKNENENY